MSSATLPEPKVLQIPKIANIKQEFKAFTEDIDAKLTNLKTQMVKPFETLLPSGENKETEENIRTWNPDRREPHFDGARFFAYQAQ